MLELIQKVCRLKSVMAPLEWDALNDDVCEAIYGALAESAITDEQLDLLDD